MLVFTFHFFLFFSRNRNKNNQKGINKNAIECGATRSTANCDYFSWKKQNKKKTQATLKQPFEFPICPNL